MGDSAKKLSFRTIAVFWWPLAATWLMMSYEGPFLAAIIARLGDPEHNLAAWGVSFSFAIIVEAPIIMLMSASTALVRDRVSYARLRNFTVAANGLITLAMLGLLFTPAFDLIMLRLIGLPPNVAGLTHTALILLLPWPGAIGFRRFYQGILIRGGQTRRVAYGTVIRLVSVTGTALALYSMVEWPGAWVGAASASAGVCAEGLAAWLMAVGAVRRLRETEPRGDAPPKSYRETLRFYIPLALTSTLALAAQPVVTFFVGHSRHALESLAVLPVIHGLGFIFRSVGLSYQEVVIVKLGERFEHREELARFACVLGLASTAGLALIVWTPLAGVWFEGISGLTPELARFAAWPARIIVLFPALTVLLSWQRATLVNSGGTAPVTYATAVEVAGIATLLYLGIDVFDLTGAVAAAVALILGRIVGNTYLLRPVSRAGRAFEET